MIHRRRGRRSRAGSEAFEAINITPFTDVLLVLLIIFMIAGSSMAPTGLGLSGLATRSGQAVSQEPSGLVVEIDRKGSTRLLFGDKTLKWTELRGLPRATLVTLSIHPETPAEQAVRQYDRLLDMGFEEIEWAPPRSP